LAVAVSGSQLYERAFLKTSVRKESKMMSTHVRSFCALAVGVLVGLICAAAPADVYTTIAMSGNPAPGTSGNFSGINGASVNSAGLVGFQSYSSDGSHFCGLFSGNGVSTSAIALQGNGAPGTSGTYDSLPIAGPPINSSAQAAFLATTTDSTHSQGVFLNSSAIALVGNHAPGTSGNYSDLSLTTPVLNSSGQVAFIASTTDVSHGSGVFLNSSAIALKGNAAPGGGNYGSFDGNVALNDSGKVAFHATTTAGDGVFLNSNAVAVSGSHAPGTSGNYTQFDTNVALNNSGQVAFYAYTNDVTYTRGMFLNTSSSPVALQGDPAPGTAGNYENMTSPVINAVGQVAFKSETSDSEHNLGIFRDSTAIALSGNPAPDHNGVFYNFANPTSIIAGGAVCFEANLRGTAGGSSDNYGCFLADGQDMVQVARVGQSLAGSTISDFLGTSNVAANDNGQVAFDVNLANYTAIICLYTPDLHFRGMGGGNWDDHINWTLSIAPASVHNVFIDPTMYTYVNGPAVAATVKNLTIGAKGTNQATLLMSGGALTALGTVNIQSTGQITLSSGSLTAATINNFGAMNSFVGSTVSAGSFVNSNQATLGGTTSVSGTLENDATLYVTGTVTGSGAVLNVGTMTLSNGTISTSGGITNDYSGSFSAQGTITGVLTNNGAMTLSGLVTAGSGVENFGTVTAPSGTTLRLSGGSSDNYGIIQLTAGSVSSGTNLNNYGTVQGHGAVSAGLKNFGLIYASDTGTMLTLSSFFSMANYAGGELRVADGATMNVPNTFTSAGAITLMGTGSVFSGAAITNYGLISGQGRVSNPVLNSGTIRASGGQLTLAGAGNTNTSIGMIQAGAGATVLYMQGLAINAGTINLSGGTLDTNNQLMTNNGSITGYGTIRTGGLENSTGKSIGVGGGNLDVFGPATNDGTVTTQAGRTTTFYGLVNGGGSFPGAGTVAFLGGFSPGHSPASVTFGGNVMLCGGNDTTMEIGGTLAGSGHDKITVTGQLSLDGTLDVTLINSYVPTGGSVFDLFSAGSMTGTFATVNLPAVTGMNWDTSTLYTAGDIGIYSNGDVNRDGAINASDIDAICRHFGSAAASQWKLDGDGKVVGQGDVDYLLKSILHKAYGDSNLDGKVDFTDFQVLLDHWQNHGAGWATDDFTGDGTVDFADFQKLLDNWNPAGTTESPVPEPATLSLLALGGLTLLRRRK
jgi:hypothetical protein